jgi:hypothetical protein
MMNGSATPSFLRAAKPMIKIFGYSVDVTLTVVLAHLTMMLIFALLVSGDLLPLTLDKAHHSLPWFVFSTETFTSSQWMSLFLYPFFHDIRSEHFLFAVEMLLLFFCSRNLENHIGRMATLFYHASLILLPPLLLLGLSQVSSLDFQLSSSLYLTITLCLTYLLFIPQSWQAGVPLRLLTWLLIGFCSVFFIAQKSWTQLAHFSTALTVSILYFELIGAGRSAGLLYLFRPLPLKGFGNDLSDPALNSIPDAERADVSILDSTDELLEKISRSGIASLTEEERQLLVKASKHLNLKHEWSESR